MSRNLESGNGKRPRTLSGRDPPRNDDWCATRLRDSIQYKRWQTPQPLTNSFELRPLSSSRFVALQLHRDRVKSIDLAHRIVAGSIVSDGIRTAIGPGEKLVAGNIGDPRSQASKLIRANAVFEWLFRPDRSTKDPARDAARFPMASREICASDGVTQSNPTISAFRAVPFWKVFNDFSPGLLLAAKEP